MPSPAKHPRKEALAITLCVSVLIPRTFSHVILCAGFGVGTEYMLVVQMDE